jgi:hypothetical protein
MAEIRTALAGTLKDAPDSPCSADSGSAEAPSPVSPGKVRVELTDVRAYWTCAEPWYCATAKL